MSQGGDDKYEALRRDGVLHPHPERVTDALFQNNDFFDARDLLQVKYEMLRRVQVEAWTVTAAAGAFGFSRPAFYQAQALFTQAGLVGLMPQRPGPRQGHKLSDAVVAFLVEQHLQQPELPPAALADWLEQELDVKVHPRSIERALQRRLKKGL